MLMLAPYLRGHEASPWRSLGQLNSADSTGTRHVLGNHQSVELLAGEVAELDRRIAQRALVLVRVLGDGRGVVVADVLVERGDEHERVADVFGDLLLVGLHTLDGELAER